MSARDGARMADGSLVRRGASPLLLAAGIVLVAINLRPAAASMGPVLGRIEAGTGMSSGWAGALATMPVLCFGLLAPIAPMLGRRLGVHGTVAVAMWALVCGLLVRLIGGVGFLFVGTACAGAGIAIANVLLPVMVRRDFAERAGSAMALFTAALIGFAALSAGVTVPLANALGGGWRPGLGVWAVPALVAALAWAPALIRRQARGRDQDPPPIAEPPGRLLRSALAWQVTLFFAVQAGGFYATLAWLPSIFRAHGASESQAGLLLSISMVMGVATALTLPGVAARLRHQRSLVAACCLLMALGWIGILLAPMSAPYLWVVLLGLGQNASFPLALMLIVLRGGTVASTEGLSTLSQSVGYGLAAFAPVAVGAIHALTRSWTPDVILLLAMLGPQLGFGLAAARDRQLARPPRVSEAEALAGRIHPAAPATSRR